MNPNEAKQEYARHLSDATHCFCRALRMERMGDLRAADANWLDGIYNNMQALRQNLQEAIALH